MTSNNIGCLLETFRPEDNYICSDLHYVCSDSDYCCSVEGVSPRDQQLIDAAIEVLGTRGARQLTHRAVDAAAGVPMGSTSNRFRTREALLVGVLRRVLALDVEAWTTLAMQARVGSVEGLAEVLGRLVLEQVGTSRTLALARRAIFMEAAHNPALRSEIASGRHELASWLAPVLADLGSPEPEVHLRDVLALMDGLIGHQLAVDGPAFDPARSLAALLRGLLP
jgi:DNA-binding transcriptional regulator YbjK